MGVFALSLMALGMWEFVNTFNFGISKKIFLLIILWSIPTIINMIGVTSVADISKVIICIVIIHLFSYLVLRVLKVKLILLKRTVLYQILVLKML